MTNWKRVVLVGGTVGLLMGLVVGQARGGEEADDQRGHELYCMAEAIYFESGNQPFVGKMAVAEVILNRVQHIGYPDTVCDVVHQGPVRESWKTKQNPDLPDSDRMYYPIKWKCQFTYYCDGKSDEITESETWEESLNAAYLMYDGRVTVAEGATHYHATYVKPHWASQLRKVVQIEDHVFYK
tara:strand:- start:11032 stop:11580 length:549 start_codon:yes stop_codon:yes gene_type:complete